MRTAHPQGSGEYGFTLLETIVALVLVASVFVALHQGFAAGWRGVAAADRERAALRIARRELAEAGITRPLLAGRYDGRDSGGLAWNVEIAPHDAPASSPLSANVRPAAVVPYAVTASVTWRDWYGPRRLTLWTIKLGGVDLAR